MNEEKRQVPSVGQVVHYFAYGTPGGEYPKTFRAAIITEVELQNEPESRVGLAVLNPTGLFFNREVPYSAEGKSGCWSWPPYVASITVKK